MRASVVAKRRRIALVARGYGSGREGVDEARRFISVRRFV